MAERVSDRKKRELLRDRGKDTKDRRDKENKKRTSDGDKIYTGKK